MKRILVAHGPNLDLLGSREPEVYGYETLDQLNCRIVETARALGFDAHCFQSNSESQLCTFLLSKASGASGIVINPGILTHYGTGLRVTIQQCGLIAVEVHLSNIHAREHFRRQSVITPVCKAQIAGLGSEGYLAAIRYLATR